MTSRTIMCTVCLEDVTVYELPREFIDPNLYVCADCLTGDILPAQLGLEPRQEVRRYDPAISENPL